MPSRQDAIRYAIGLLVEEDQSWREQKERRKTVGNHQSVR
jgi:hypothetical protein